MKELGDYCDVDVECMSGDCVLRVQTEAGGAVLYSDCAEFGGKSCVVKTKKCMKALDIVSTMHTMIAILSVIVFFGFVCAVLSCCDNCE